MKHTSRKIAKNSVFLAIARGVELSSGVVTLILLTRYLSVLEFGKFSFCWATALALTPIVAFGTPRILIREISVQKEKAFAFLVSGLFVNLLMLLLATLLISLLAFLFKPTWEVKILPLLLAVLSQSIRVMVQTVGTIFIAYENMEYDAALTTIIKVISIILILIAIKLHCGILWLFGAISLANFFGFCFALIIVFVKFIKMPKRIGKDINCRYLLRESYPIALATFLTQAYTLLNVFILKSFHNMVQVALFQAPQRVITPLLMLPNSFLFAFVPAFSRLASGDTSSLLKLETIYTRLMKYIFILSIPLCVSITINAQRIIFLVFGEKYQDATFSLQILVWTIVPLFSGVLLSSMLTSIRKQQVLIVSNSVCFLVSLGSGLLLIPKYGHMGASVSTLISYVVLFIFKFYFVSKWLISIPLYKILFHPVWAALSMLFFCIFLDEKIHFMVLAITSFFLYFALLIQIKIIPLDDLKNVATFIKSSILKFNKQPKHNDPL